MARDGQGYPRRRRDMMMMINTVQIRINKVLKWYVLVRVDNNRVDDRASSYRNRYCYILFVCVRRGDYFARYYDIPLFSYVMCVYVYIYIYSSSVCMRKYVG